MLRLIGLGVRGGRALPGGGVACAWGGQGQGAVVVGAGDGNGIEGAGGGGARNEEARQDARSRGQHQQDG